MTSGLRDDARVAYEAFAGSYDEFNHRYMYERWTGRLLACAEHAGLEGTRLLDLGCGTGLSMVVPLRRGMSVTGCDVSPAMLAEARTKLGGRAALVEADMRAMPLLGEFDLIWSVSDALNYLLEPAELRAALRGIHRNLAPTGVVVFDLNTLAGYRNWVSAHSFRRAGRQFHWRGAPRRIVPGGLFEASFEGDGMTKTTHRQRHFPEAEVKAAIAASGLRPTEVYGEADGALEPGLDEDHHTKAVYVARVADGRRG